MGIDRFRLIRENSKNECETLGNFWSAEDARYEMELQVASFCSALSRSEGHCELAECGNADCREISVASSGTVLCSFRIIYEEMR